MQTGTSEKYKNWPSSKQLTVVAPDIEYPGIHERFILVPGGTGNSASASMLVHDCGNPIQESKFIMKIRGLGT